MSIRRRTILYRVGVRVAASVGVWLAGVGLAGWYLYHMAAEEYRGGVRAMTGPDSVGLPLLAFAMGLAALLLVANLGAAVVAKFTGPPRRRVGP